MTDLLHMRDNYIQEFDAKIVELGEGHIVLDRTAFYPEGGGQVGDQGFFFGNDCQVRISNTVKRAGKIQHLFEGGHSFEIGSNVSGKLDWDRRHECMRFHTAQHVLSRYLQIHYDVITVSLLVGGTVCRVECRIVAVEIVVDYEDISLIGLSAIDTA